MDISGVSSSTISMIANTGTQTSVAMQKKVMEMQEQTAAKLIESVQQSTKELNSPTALGNNIDVKV
jgi:iron-sulfur cluster repair protein YtfE (RIC family)